MKKLLTILFSISVLLASLCSCEGKMDVNGKKTTGSKTKQAIQENIAELGGKPWNKSLYLEIKDNQIPGIREPERAKNALQALLDKTYCDVMVAEGTQILSACTKAQHSHLDALMKELGLFNEVTGKADLEAKYKEHQDLLAFLPKMRAQQSVKTYTDKYDVAFETNMKKQVADQKAKNPTCAYVNDELKKMDSYFKIRRNNYAKKLVEKYCECTSYNRSDELKVKSLIRSACNNIPEALEAQMEEFKQRFEAQKE